MIKKVMLWNLQLNWKWNDERNATQPVMP